MLIKETRYMFFVTIFLSTTYFNFQDASPSWDGNAVFLIITLLLKC